MATSLCSLLLFVFLGTAYSQTPCSNFGIGVTVEVRSVSNAPLPDTFPASLTGTISFICYVSLPTSSYLWYRNGVELSQTGRQLMISNIRGEDGGAYTCAGVLTSPSPSCLTHESTSFTVTTPPDVVVNNPREITTNIQQGSSITLSCSATGWPTPIVQWTKGGMVLSNTGEYTIPAAGSTDVGAYSCEADNPRGNMTQIRVIRLLTTITPTEDSSPTIITDRQIQKAFNETADQTGFYVGVGVVAGVSVAITLLTVTFCIVFLCMNRAPPAAHNPYEDWPDGKEPEITEEQPEVVVESQIAEEAPSAPPPMNAEPFQPPEDEEVNVPSAMPSQSEIGEVF